jgi:predicted kinase
VGAADSRLDLAERERLRLAHSDSGLDRRLSQLPEGHPSSSGYADSPAPRDEPDHDGSERDRIRPLTDAEYAEHVAEVETRLEAAREAGLATDIQHTVDRGREVWSDERQSLHDDIVSELYGRAADVPCEHKAILAGGLAGAGKSTVLAEHAKVDLSRYLMINPDAIKEELARRGAIPVVEGLSPMEASDLIHEESSHLARRLGHKAQAEGRNLIWDITMSTGASTDKRIAALRAAGYSHVEGIFVDIPVEVSQRRAETRHREGHDTHRAGDGYGGRYVHPRLILDQADTDWSSQNRKNFERAKGLFDGWSLYDNSIDGQPPVLVATQRPSDASDKKGG